MNLQDFVASHEAPYKREKAARRLGISTRTLIRWLLNDSRPKGRAMLKKLRRIGVEI